MYVWRQSEIYQQVNSHIRIFTLNPCQLRSTETLLRHGFWRGSFASHCLRGISALSAPLRSIFLIWNMSSIHYEERSRRLDATSNQMDSVSDNCVSMADTQCSCCLLLWWEGSALFFSNLGLLGVALGIATSIVVDGCGFNFSTYHCILFHINNLNAKKCAKDSIMSCTKDLRQDCLLCMNK